MTILRFLDVPIWLSFAECDTRLGRSLWRGGSQLGQAAERLAGDGVDFEISFQQKAGVFGGSDLGEIEDGIFQGWVGK